MRIRRRGHAEAPYDPRRAHFAPGTAPYVARDIEPSAFKELTASSTNRLAQLPHDEYESAHGFASSHRTAAGLGTISPSGTKWLRRAMADWPAFFKAPNIAWGRRQLADYVVKELRIPGRLDPAAARANLRLLAWSNGGRSPRTTVRKRPVSRAAAAEAATGFREELLPRLRPDLHGRMDALRRKGWKSVGVYPQSGMVGWYRCWGCGKEEPARPSRPRPTGPGCDTEWRSVAAQERPLSVCLRYYWSPRTCLHR